MTNTNNNSTNLKAIMDAEKFLTDNYLNGVFYLHCGELREQGIKEKWDHEARVNAITKWLETQDINPFYEMPRDLNVSLTEWYEKIYLPSKWTNNSNRRRYNNGNNQNQEPNGEKQ